MRQLKTELCNGSVAVLEQTMSVHRVAPGMRDDLRSVQRADVLLEYTHDAIDNVCSEEAVLDERRLDGPGSPTTWRWDERR